MPAVALQMICVAGLLGLAVLAVVLSRTKISGAVWFATDNLNHLQFLSIRNYLSLVFVTLIALLLGVSIWP